jgi:hypothetical protein
MRGEAEVPRFLTPSLRHHRGAERASDPVVASVRDALFDAIAAASEPERETMDRAFGAITRG